MSTRFQVDIPVAQAPAPVRATPRVAPSPAEKAEQPPVDTVATTAPAPELPLGARLKKAFYKQTHKNNRIYGSPFNKLTFGMVLGAGAWTAAKIAANIAGAPTVALALGEVAVTGGALFAGYMGADVASGLLHHWADNYANPDAKNPVVRKFAKQAQRHHFHPTKLGNYTISAWANPVSLVSWVPLVAANALNMPTPILAGTLSLVLGTTVYGVFHMWSHKPKKDVPAIGRFLQKAGIAVKPEIHNQHHALPWNSDFCLVSGLMNKPLNAIKFWPRYEKAVYKITGKAAESWSVPAYKSYVDGTISREDYIAQLKDVKHEFRNTRFNEIKEKWGID